MGYRTGQFSFYRTIPAMTAQNKITHLLLGVTGGVVAYKAAEFGRLTRTPVAQPSCSWPSACAQ